MSLFDNVARYMSKISFSMINFKSQLSIDSKSISIANLADKIDEAKPPFYKNTNINPNHIAIKFDDDRVLTRSRDNYEEIIYPAFIRLGFKNNEEIQDLFCFDIDAVEHRTDNLKRGNNIVIEIYPSGKIGVKGNYSVRFMKQCLDIIDDIAIKNKDSITFIGTASVDKPGKGRKPKSHTDSIILRDNKLHTLLENYSFDFNKEEHTDITSIVEIIEKEKDDKIMYLKLLKILGSKEVYEDENKLQFKSSASLTDSTFEGTPRELDVSEYTDHE